MPNWTSTTINANGQEEEIAAFLAGIRSESEPVFDFATLIPMPELLRHTCSGRRTIEGKAVESWYVIDPANPYSDEGVRLFTPEEEAELARIGAKIWYDWACNNWGTKWNACRAEITERYAGTVAIRFETAWAAPIPIFEALMERFPSISFEFVWQNEGEPHFHSIERVAEEVLS
jgi:hypothetical protein